MKTSKRLIGTATAVCLFGAIGVLPMAGAANAAPAPTAAAAALPAASTVPVTGTLNGAPFTGELSNLSTSVVDGVLQLSGTLTGAGLPGGSLDFTTPILPSASCDVLNLDLGPLHLNVLGLVIDLDPVVLDITAVPGSGNLLGNLLCAVAGLLDNGGPLAGVSALLNRLLAGLGLA